MTGLLRREPPWSPPGSTCSPTPPRRRPSPVTGRLAPAVAGTEDGPRRRAGRPAAGRGQRRGGAADARRRGAAGRRRRPGRRSASARRVPARRAADRLGPGVRPAARRADRRGGVRGAGRRPGRAAAALADRRRVALEPCHHRARRRARWPAWSRRRCGCSCSRTPRPGTAWCSLNEGLGKVLRYGAYGPEVIERLRWMSAVLGPVLQAAVRGARPGRRQGDHRPDAADGRRGAQPQPGGHPDAAARPAARPGRRPASPSADVAARPGSSPATTTSSSTWRCRRASCAPTPPATSPARPWSWRWPATAPTSASRSPAPETRWFTGPALTPEGLFLGGYGPDDANPDIGDSAITETAGIGGFAMAAAPAIVRFVGGTVADALRDDPADVRDHPGRAPAVRGAGAGVPRHARPAST